jgi:hypothetical protein
MGSIYFSWGRRCSVSLKGFRYSSEFNNLTHSACLEDITLLFDFPDDLIAIMMVHTGVTSFGLSHAVGGSISRDLDGETVPPSLPLRRPNLGIYQM